MLLHFNFNIESIF